MAKEEQAVTMPASTMQDLVQSIKDVVQSNKAEKQATLAEITARSAPKVKLKCARFFYNGVYLLPHEIDDSERELINQLKPGRYNHRKWEVIRRGDRSIDVRVPMKSVEHRLSFKNETKGEGFKGMLKMIITEAEAKAAKRKAGNFDEDDDY